MAGSGLLDLLVLGGGINGTAVARDAAGRGLAVALVERGDLASGASSASTRLIHGGLRYLEFGAFGLVAKALGERELLMAAAPHAVQPMPFLLPVLPWGRPAWKLRLGLFLYDRLSRRRSLPGAVPLRLREEPAAGALRPDLTRAFRLWDAWTDDARLVVLFARDAAARGAAVHLRDPPVEARRIEAGWEVRLASGRRLAARMLVNCTGPWAERVARNLLRVPDPPRLRLVQGAHLITRRVNRGPDAWILQQPDGRVLFVIPLDRSHSYIGTTETPVEDPAGIGCTEEEEAYLLAGVNAVLARPLAPSDIVHRIAGVRPLVLEPGKTDRETSRDWRLVRHDAATLSVVGGKLTTARRLAEDVLRAVAPRTRPWTARAVLPGGDIPRARGSTPESDYAAFVAGLIARHADYDPAIVRRLARRWGTEAEPMLEGGLGSNLGGLFEAEIRHMREREWAASPEDILFRRTRIGLSDPAAVARIEAALARTQPA